MPTDESYEVIREALDKRDAYVAGTATRRILLEIRDLVNERLASLAAPKLAPKKGPGRPRKPKAAKEVKPAAPATENADLLEPAPAN